MADRSCTADHDVDVAAALPIVVDCRGDASVASATSDYFNKAPIGQIFGGLGIEVEAAADWPVRHADPKRNRHLALQRGDEGRQRPTKAFGEALANIAQITG